MKNKFKLLLILVGGLFTVMMAVSLFMPNEVMTSKWVRVAQSKDTVMTALLDLQSWPQWNGLLSGAADVSISDSIISWTGGNGRKNQIRMESVEVNGLSTPISLGGEAIMRSGFSVEKRTADSVQVVWFVIEDLNWYPWEKFYGMMAADMKGPLMQQSLDQFKNYLQTR